MTRIQLVPTCALALCVGLTACKDDERGSDESGGSIGDVTASGDAGTDSVTASASDGGGDDGPMKFDTTVDGGQGGCDNVDVKCTDQIDLLFVIDNSGSMGEEQLNLAQNFPFLIEKLENLTDSGGNLVKPDVNIMVTTSDFGNPLCLPSFYSEPREPEKGTPIDTNCNDRIARFTFMSNPPVNKPEACTQVCPDGTLAPSGPFINFSPDGNNVPDVPDADVNGDGIDDSAVAQTLSCLGPVGIDGCGYEAPLENMLQALNPSSPWNTSGTPFLRENALTAIVVITDEADCSVKEYSIMEDAMYQETDPDDGAKKPSSAICWNAGVTCNGPNAMGIYSECQSVTEDNLQPVSRYTNYLIGELRETQKKEVIMLGILGVPLVTEHNPNAPFQPTAGGVFDLVYRTWNDGIYPAGDILPDDAANGLDGADKEFDFGIGPGCTGEDGMGGFTGQAVPPVRVKEVCEALNIENDDGTTSYRCCIESICDTDFSAAINCLTGIISETIMPQG